MSGRGGRKQVIETRELSDADYALMDEGFADCENYIQYVEDMKSVDLGLRLINPDSPDENDGVAIRDARATLGKTTEPMLLIEEKYGKRIPRVCLNRGRELRENVRSKLESLEVKAE